MCLWTACFALLRLPLVRILFQLAQPIPPKTNPARAQPSPAKPKPSQAQPSPAKPSQVQPS